MSETAFTIVSTEEFWNRLCDPRAFRSTPTRCVIGNAVYVTKTPPEHVPGFMEERVALVISNLGGAA